MKASERRAKNEKQLPVPAIALVAVVDTSVLKLADEKTARGLATHFFLTTEVRHPEDLENADILLSDHPKAPLALDLLLGCQGWRRFAEQDPQKFQERQQQAKAPIFLANSPIRSIGTSQLPAELGNLPFKIQSCHALTLLLAHQIALDLLAESGCNC